MSAKKAHRSYTGEFKCLVVETMRRNHWTHRETDRHFKLAKDRSRKWNQTYSKYGPEGLMRETRGRHSDNAVRKILPVIGSIDLNLVGKRVYDLRKEANLSQPVLAHRCNISGAHLCRIEKGISMSTLSTLARIAQELGCDLRYLATGKGASISSEEQLARQFDALFAQLSPESGQMALQMIRDLQEIR